MNTWISRLAIACTLAFGAGCGDDDANPGGGGGGEGGEPAENGGDGSGGTAGDDGTGGTAGDEGDGNEGGSPTCEPPTPPENGDELAIIGEYDDSYEGVQIVTATEWRSGDDVFYISSFDNEARRIIAQNAETNAYNACRWSLFEWTVTEDEQLYFCQAIYAAASEEMAGLAPSSDSTDPANTGCSQFPWTALTPR